ncbi:MAG: flagellar hook protein FlgE [Methylococcaceae bacterium]|nr:flagellar hook protein FlgE [Methylococcaceae bacterium]MCI0666741.1 flagellar hook protein FlgE [Methylococcaceae bacterium]MCI0732865.1 flagellar hook protein FlgE [Methylococcaceae bacterium]
MTFKTALSGLNAASIDLAVTGNNIANASTNGFKESRAEFADVYATTIQGIGSATPGSGVRVTQIAQQFTQGNVDFTNNNLDLAINGEGFYVLSDNGAREYTRAGAFGVDASGYIVNHAEQRLQGFPALTTAGVTSFNTGALSDLQLATTIAPPNATTSVQANINLDAREVAPTTPFTPTDPTSFNDSTSLTLYDSLGNPHTGTYYYVATATPNRWDSYLYVNGTNVTSGGNASVPLVFGTNGTLLSAGGNTNGQFVYDNFAIPGANPLSVTMDYSASTQYGNNFAVNSLNQDGYTTGRLTGIEISEDGIVSSRFTNGRSTPLGQIALAKFPNPQGLTKLGDTNWGESFESGSVVLGAPRSSNFGGVQSGALEASTVDISEQLVNLIIAQRNFQANAQVISTQDEITQTIINIR